MTRFESFTEAQSAGFTIEHRPEEQRFVIIDSNNNVVGYARYRLMGDTGIDFNGTIVEPTHRGTGLSGLLVERALGDDIVMNREVHASCWYVADAIRDNPGFLAKGATSSYA